MTTISSKTSTFIVNGDRESGPALPGVCIIDDEKEVCEGLERLLAREPQIAWATCICNWHEAEREVRKRSPGIVLLDLRMSGGANGMDLIKPLFAACPGARVVILSGSVSKELVESALDLGAWGFICKGIELEQIVPLIQRVARGEIALCPTSLRCLGEG